MLRAILLFCCVFVTAFPNAVAGEPSRDRLERVPSMLGDLFVAPSGTIQGERLLDRLMVVATDLDAPNPLPGLGSTLTITEPGPVGVFESSLTAQQIQTLLRNAQPLPAAVLAGQLADDATLTTSATIADIQTQLAGTVDAFDIIGVAQPNTYDAGVEAILVARNSQIGVLVYDATGSGAFLQGADDTLDAGDDLDAFYFYDYTLQLQLDSPFAASVRAGTLKAANSGTPLPQDRFFLDFTSGSNVGFRPGGATLNRFVMGAERAFLDSLFSIELRLPFAATTSEDFNTTSNTVVADDDVNFGNITMLTKCLLYRNDSIAVSAGLSFSLPTAASVSVGNDVETIARINNDAVHLGPFLAGLYAPSERCFFQSYFQLDFASQGNEVMFDSDGSGLRGAGRLNDPTYAFVDLGIGYWLNEHGQGIPPTALMAELHYSNALGDADLVQAGNFQIGGDNLELDSLNTTVGLSMSLTTRTSLSAGYIASLDGQGPNRGGIVRLEYR